MSDVEALIRILSEHRYYAADDGGMGDNCQCGFDVTHEGRFDNEPESLNRSHDEHVAALLSLSPTPTGDERDIQIEARRKVEETLAGSRDMPEAIRSAQIILVLDRWLSGRVAPEPVYEYRVRNTITGQVSPKWEPGERAEISDPPEGWIEERFENGSWLPVVSTSKEQKK